MLERIALSACIPFAILMLGVSAAGQLSVHGEVIEIIDGRTVIVAIPSGKVRVELQFIEVPEPGQELYATVKEHLRSLVIGKVVVYRPTTIFNDRTIGRMMLKDVDVSQQMLRDGAAWHIPSQVSGQVEGDHALYASIETAAKNEKRGVWSIPGLRPAWEIRAKKKENEQRQEYNSSASSGSVRSAANRKPGMWADINPSLGNVGALMSGYNAKTKTGFVSTSLLGINGRDNDLAAEMRLAIDVTFYYREDDRKGRKGVFVITLVSASRKLQFLNNNDLWVMGDGKNTNIGKPRRTVSKDGDYVWESLRYEVSRNTINRMVNSDGVFMKVGAHVIYLTGFTYLLYNMLEISQ